MASRLHRFASMIALLGQLLGVVFFVAFHHDLDGTSGSRRPSIEPHADADHCRHFDTSHIEPCAACSGSFTGMTAPAVIATASPVHSDSRLPLPLPSFTPSSGVHLAAFRRGPPAVLGSFS